MVKRIVIYTLSEIIPYMIMRKFFPEKELPKEEIPPKNLRGGHNPVVNIL